MPRETENCESVINPTDSTCNTPWRVKDARKRACGYCALLLRLQFCLVLRNEGADVLRHVQELQPLFLVERHRKAPHAVDRDRPLLAYLQANTGRRAFFQRCILPAQAFQLSFHIVVGHCIPCVLAMDESQVYPYQPAIGTGPMGTTIPLRMSLPLRPCDKLFWSHATRHRQDR